MRSCKRGVNIFCCLLIFLALVVSPFKSNAQTLGNNDPACGDADPEAGPCPLDTEVVVLVVVAGLATAVYLHRKQKALQV